MLREFALNLEQFLKLGLGDFSHGIARQSVDDFDLLGNFVGGHLAVAPVFQIIVFEAGAVLQANDGYDCFAPGIVFDTDDCNFGNGVMRQQDTFDFQCR